MDLSEYVINGGWILMATPAELKLKYYSCCPEPYPSVYFYLHIRRRTLYYGFNMIIPSLLISFMTVLGFTLPPDAGEKITLEITILLSVCLFLNIVAEITPPTSETVPLIGWPYTKLLAHIHLFLRHFLLMLHDGGVGVGGVHGGRAEFTLSIAGHSSNESILILLNWLPWLLLMKRPGREFNIRSIRKNIKSMSIKSESLMRNIRPIGNSVEVITFDQHHDFCAKKNLKMTTNSDEDSFGRRNNEAVNLLMSSTETADDSSVHPQLLLLHRINANLEFIAKKTEREEQNDNIENDWRFAAMVVDRLCLIMFSVFITTFTCGIMMSAPHLLA